MSNTMMAVVYREYGDSKVLSYESYRKPTPAANEVLVKVAAAGINPVAWKLRKGFIQSWPHSFPQIPGWDVSGTVVETGSDVKDLQVGNEVYAYNRPEWSSTNDDKIADNGCCAQFVSVPAHRVALKPTTASHTQAGSIPLAGLTAWQGIFDQGGLQDNGTLVVFNASGGVGSFAVQFAKARGCRVIGTCSSRNLQYVTDLGADVVIDYAAPDFEAQLAAALPDGADVAYDCVGETNANLAVQFVKQSGIAVSIANWGIGDIAKAAGKTGKSFLVCPSSSQLTEIATLFDSGQVRAPEIATFPLNQTAEAHDASETHRTRGKIVMVVE
jgi:NADPH:quinone reductase-like Zn-dependent oxidoreductase